MHMTDIIGELIILAGLLGGFWYMVAYMLLRRRHARLVAAVRKLMLTWSAADPRQTIPPLIVREVCLALLDEPGLRRTAQDVLLDIEDRNAT